jgi:hypothetical protein
MFFNVIGSHAFTPQTNSSLTICLLSGTLNDALRPQASTIMPTCTEDSEQKTERSRFFVKL